MREGSIIEIVDQFGYMGLFFWIWLGVFGAPVPNEIIVGSVGASTSLGILQPQKAFMVTYIGLLAAITTSYLLGRLIGYPILNWLKNKKRAHGYFKKAEILMNKYQSFSLIISYMIPGVRNAVPFLYGIAKYPFRSFALRSYTIILCWLFIYFITGLIFAENITLLIR